ncbi:MAG TPA: phosphoribosylamine--glycine ligase [Candidatus Hydrogenedentes bacterium]|nr:phosphoribosylamine--glycine ligase [Candidatus Hydrogenedentota bacterium]
MKVLVIGSGGREHALCWKIARSPMVSRVYCAPGNPGITSLDKGENVPVGARDFDSLAAFIEEKDISLTVVGPEDPLAAGIVDYLVERGETVFGPSAAAARLEASKAFAKAFMRRHNIPTAEAEVFDDPESARRYVQAHGAPVVIKADGLAAGKGVTVARTLEEALDAVDQVMERRVFGDAGARVVVEDFLEGEEASILAFCDGERVVPLPTSQDHKPVFDGDRGPNTGGMGAYSPAPVVTPALEEAIRETILRPVVEGMAAEGTPYRGVLYAGLMITARGPKVVEFNVRFGDPETQAVLPRLTSDLVPILMACAEGSLDRVSLACSDRPCVTVVMASGGYPGAYEKGKIIKGIDIAQRDPDVMVFHAGTALVEGHLVTAGGRVLNVTALADTLEEAVKKAYSAVDAIHFEGAHFRRDIARRAMTRT